MFDVGFLELLVCGIIALLILGPERLPGAARSAGRWIGRSRRLVRQFTTELDRQLKADELREKLRQEGDVGLEDLKKNVSDGMKEARKYEHMIVSGNKTLRPRPGYADSGPANHGNKTDEDSRSSTDEPSQRTAAATEENLETEPPIGKPSETAPRTDTTRTKDTARDTATASDQNSDHQS